MELSDSGTTFTCKSREESADLNDFATFKLVPGRKYKVTAKLDSRQARTEVAMTAGSSEQLVTLKLSDAPGSEAKSGSKSAEASARLSAREAAALRKELQKYFTADAVTEAKWKFPSRLEKLLARNEGAVRQLAWDAYRGAPIHAALKTNFDARTVT